MEICIENLLFLFRFEHILFLDSQFYNIDKNELTAFLRYSKILGINVPNNFYLLDYIINNCFELIDSNHKYSRYYYGTLIHLLIYNWNSHKLYLLLNKFNDYINYINYESILKGENKDTIILFYYIIKNLISIDYKTPKYSKITFL